ncbi:hypothetical protein [Mesoaciditoga lauensis]|uniref:hypothetical protein n=1 Tax=Mesoaciditoga lauensis TaxID=1495039 RepID=UPI00055DF073|nr:hypothetical protein [Mesoaciditoga lauensis]
MGEEFDLLEEKINAILKKNKEMRQKLKEYEEELSRLKEENSELSSMLETQSVRVDALLKKLEEALKDKKMK